jgi:hypothetical protein
VRSNKSLEADTQRHCAPRSVLVSVRLAAQCRCATVNSDVSLHMAARVYIRPPQSSDESTFVASARASRRIHGSWTRAPDTPERFREYLGHMAAGLRIVVRHAFATLKLHRPRREMWFRKGRVLTAVSQDRWTLAGSRAVGYSGVLRGGSIKHGSRHGRSRGTPRVPIGHRSLPR